MKKQNTDLLNIQEGSKKEIEKKEAYKDYALWKSLPPILKGNSKEAQKIRKAVMFDDYKIEDLLAYETQKDFAKAYNIHPDTLTDWNVRLRETQQFEETRMWLNNLVKNVMLKMYQVAMSSDPKAHNDRKLLLNYAGFIEKIAIDHQGEGLAEFMKRTLNIK